MFPTFVPQQATRPQPSTSSASSYAASAAGTRGIDKLVLSASASLKQAHQRSSQHVSQFLGDLDLGRLFPRPRSDSVSPPQASTSGRVLEQEAVLPRAKGARKSSPQHHNHHHLPPGPKPGPLALSWAGSGLYFFWQLGAVQYLAQHFDLTKVPMTGASGGSIAACLAACGVSADHAFNRAYELSLKYNIWQEPGSYMGVWGGLVEEWLDELLPADAHERCRGRITVVVTTLPDWRQVGISDFRDKRDLIDAIMASSHIPLVLDRRMAKSCRGRPCVDGSFPDFFFGNCELLTRGGNAVVFDYFDDKLLKRQGRMDMLLLTSLDELKNRMNLGYDFARRLHERGAFHAFEQQEGVLLGKALGAVADVQPEQLSSMSMSSMSLSSMDEVALLGSAGGDARVASAPQGSRGGEKQEQGEEQEVSLSSLLAQQGSPMLLPRWPVGLEERGGVAPAGKASKAGGLAVPDQEVEKRRKEGGPWLRLWQ